jgi:hypothetical protein
MSISKMDDAIYNAMRDTGSRPTRIDLHYLDIEKAQSELLEAAQYMPEYEGEYSSSAEHPEYDPGWVMLYKGIPVYRVYPELD